MEILIVEDHKLFLDGFSLLLKKLNHKLSITAVESGEKALEVINKHSDWDLIILDISLPDIDGLEILKTIRQQGELTPVVFVSATDNIFKIASMYFYGANGFIHKKCDSQIMLSALQKIIDGEIYYFQDTKIAIDIQLEKLINHTGVSEKLTRRQLEVLKIMSKGASNKEISEVLFISETTVKSHISIIYQLFEVNKRVECIRKAEWLGLV